VASLPGMRFLEPVGVPLFESLLPNLQPSCWRKILELIAGPLLLKILLSSTQHLSATLRPAALALPPSPQFHMQPVLPPFGHELRDECRTPQRHTPRTLPVPSTQRNEPARILWPWLVACTSWLRCGRSAHESRASSLTSTYVRRGSRANLKPANGLVSGPTFFASAST